MANVDMGTLIRDTMHAHQKRTLRNGVTCTCQPDGVLLDLPLIEHQILEVQSALDDGLRRVAVHVQMKLQTAAQRTANVEARMRETLGQQVRAARADELRKAAADNPYGGSDWLRARADLLAVEDASPWGSGPADGQE